MKKSLLWTLVSSALFIFLISSVSTSQVVRHSAPIHQKPTLYSVNTVLIEWPDIDRHGSMPVKMYYPVSKQREHLSFPVIIFCNDAGRTRDEFDYLGLHWASQGYVCVHMPQNGKDYSSWEGNNNRGREKAHKSFTRRYEPQREDDVRFAISNLVIMNRDDRIFSRLLDLSRIGVVGDYFDAKTAMNIAGQWAPVSRGRSGPGDEARIKAIIVLSAPKPNRQAMLDIAYSRISIPILEMSETIAAAPAPGRKERARPFDFIVSNDQYSIIFRGSEYSIFFGPNHSNFGNNDRDRYHINFIKDITTSFWNAYLKNDPEAKRWLRKGGFDNYYDGYYSRGRR